MDAAVSVRLFGRPAVGDAHTLGGGKCAPLLCLVALADSGRGAEALHRYAALEAGLRERLGVAPGDALRRLGDSDGARAMYCRALALSRSVGAHVVTLMTVGGLGALAHERGDWELAVRLTAAFEAHATELGASLSQWPGDSAETLRAEGEAALGPERLEWLWAEGRALRLDEAAELATT